MIKDKIIKDFSEVLGNIASLITILKAMNSENGDIIEKEIENTIKQAVDNLLADSFLIVHNKLKKPVGNVIKTGESAIEPMSLVVKGCVNENLDEPVEYILGPNIENISGTGDNLQESAALYSDLAKIKLSLKKRIK